jgi:predicted metal-dependent phosphoesterase TrpH
VHVVTLKVELHTHTSDDPADPIPYTATELVDRAAALGYQALAITLHDRQLEPGPLTRYAADRGVVLIPGIERTVEGRHVLLLNFSQAAERVQRFEDLAYLRTSEPEGLVVAPHPYYPLGSCLGAALERHADLFDAVEWNALFTRQVNFNRRAAAWAARHGKPIVGNCDVHRLHQLGTCYSLVEAEPSASAICQAIREGRVTVVAEPVSVVRAAWIVGELFGTDIAVRIGLLERPAAPRLGAPGIRPAGV